MAKNETKTTKAVKEKDQIDLFLVDEKDTEPEYFSKVDQLEDEGAYAD